MDTVYTGLYDESFDADDRAAGAATLLAAGFIIGTDDAGWIAEYSAGYHRIRVEAIPSGWIVSHVLVSGSFERVKAEAHRVELADAAQLAGEMVSALNQRLRLIGSVAGPLLAELRRTS